MNEAAMKLWVKGLRSGLYTQGKQALLTLEGDFCGLGVACHMLGDVPEKERYAYSFSLDSGGLPESVRRALDMFDHFGGRRDGKEIEIGGSLYFSLADANDMGRTFEEIADYVEANWGFL